MHRVDRTFVSWLGCLTVIAGLCVPVELAAQGCAMCATALGGPEDPLAQGLKVSILFLMSMPFVVVGSVGAWLYYMHRRSRTRRPVLHLLRTRREDAL